MSNPYQDVKVVRNRPKCRHVVSYRTRNYSEQVPVYCSDEAKFIQAPNYNAKPVCDKHAERFETLREIE